MTLSPPTILVIISLINRTPQFRQTCVCPGSTPSGLSQGSRADRIHSSLCVNFHLHMCSIPDLTVQSPVEQIHMTSIQANTRATTAIHLQFIQEFTKQQHDIWLTFRIKHSVLAPAQKSPQDGQTQPLLLILQLGTLCVIYLPTYNCSHV